MLTRRSLFTFAIAAMIASAAHAEPGRLKAVDRDPFVKDSAPAQTRTYVRPKVAPTVKPASNKSHPLNKPANATPVPAKPEIVVHAPEVSVSGIVASGGQRQAILATNSGSVIAKVGQKLGDYKVKAIDASSVTFEAHGKSFRVPLTSDV